MLLEKEVRHNEIIDENNTNYDEHPLNRPISTEEVLSALQKLKCKKKVKALGLTSLSPRGNFATVVSAV